MGRPTKFSDKIWGAIVGALRTGCSLDIAAAAAGISPVTLWRWRREGERDEAQDLDTEQARFVREVRQAEANVVAGIEQSLMRVAASGSEWRASSWVLARKMPLEYGETQVTEALKQQAISELMEYVERRARPEFYRELLELLVDGADEDNEPRLPEATA
jgi:hypothetical protein